MESDCKFRFTLPGNGLRNPFRKKLKFCTKRNTNSISQNREMDSVIRFRKKFVIFFMKRITESVSQFCETEFVFRFVQNFKFFLNGLCNPFPKCVSLDSRILYIVEAKLQEWLVQKISSKWLRSGRKRSRITKEEDFCGRRLMKMQHHQSGRVTLLFTVLIRSPVILVVSSSIAFVINYYCWTWGLILL